ncbi:hypothetical protein QQX09_02940 [Demequina sp. SYSU T00192]|uniref:Uncharacterized protein n=1 Tax=Demequina litoralis TaxID=3051660 RepID=A0ABT8G6N4_9MICO|nr:hypothetical protein [Demequina sp. SYSU T00192]MDN4474808.1 hypothetical protein [Demequina sp. SYSU T00192]
MDDSYNDRMAEQARLHHEQVARMHHEQARDDAALAAGVARPFALRRGDAGALDGLPIGAAPRALGIVMVVVWAVFGLAFIGVFLFIASGILGTWDAAPAGGETVWIETDDGTLVAP